VVVVAAPGERLQVVGLERFRGWGHESERPALDAEPSALALVDEGEDLGGEVAGSNAPAVAATPGECLGARHRIAQRLAATSSGRPSPCL
jgi:hypothetical protein